MYKNYYCEIMRPELRGPGAGGAKGGHF